MNKWGILSLVSGIVWMLILIFELLKSFEFSQYAIIFIIPVGLTFLVTTLLHMNQEQRELNEKIVEFEAKYKSLDSETK